METYKFVELDNGDILLQKIIIDNTSYTIINIDNGYKLLKKITNVNKSESDIESDSECGRVPNPYMMARSALIKVMFAKAKSKDFKLTVPDSAKIIKKIEEEVAKKHNLTDKVEILKKALDLFNSNVDKYLNF